MDLNIVNLLTSLTSDNICNCNYCLLYFGVFFALWKKDREKKQKLYMVFIYWIIIPNWLMKSLFCTLQSIKADPFTIQNVYFHIRSREELMVSIRAATICPVDNIYKKSLT